MCSENIWRLTVYFERDLGDKNERGGIWSSQRRGRLASRRCLAPRIAEKGRESLRLLPSAQLSTRPPTRPLSTLPCCSDSPPQRLVTLPICLPLPPCSRSPLATRISHNSTTKSWLALRKNRPLANSQDTLLCPPPRIVTSNPSMASIMTARGPQLRTECSHRRGQRPTVRLSVAVHTLSDLNSPQASHYGLPPSPRPPPPSVSSPPPVSSLNSPQSPSQRAPRPLPRIPGSMSAAPVPPPPPPPIIYGAMPEPHPYQGEDGRLRSNSIDAYVFFHFLAQVSRVLIRIHEAGGDSLKLRHTTDLPLCPLMGIPPHRVHTVDQ